MIEFDGLSFSYTPDAPSVLTDVEATVHDGEFVLVAGRTGSGKSTLLGTINGLVPTFTGGHLDGDVRVDGVSIRDRPPRAFSHLVGYVGQDPLSGFVTDTVEDELAYGMEQLGLDAQVMRRRVEETLDLLGIASLRRRALRTLSGGQQQRIAIGSVLTMHPKVLVLDEPTSALDPTAAEEVLATLARLVTDLGTTVVLAEHRLERVIPFVDSMMVIDDTGRVEVGPAAELLTRSPIVPPITELARLARWEPLPLTVRDARRLACGLTARLADSRPSPPPHRAAPVMSAAESNPALEASGIVVRYGSNVAVRDVDLHVDRGEIVALMGRNGSGKSSLLWAIQGSGPSEAGRVSIGGVDPRKLDAPARRKRVGLVPQSASDLLYLDTVEAECATADDESGAPSGSCAALLERLTPGIDAHRHPRDLSEGQRLALVVAIQLNASPQVVLLDEPTRGLDYPAKRVVTDLVRSLADEGRSVIVASHDVELVAAMADRVVVMAQGEIVTDAPTVEALCGSPAFSPQTTKILGAPWLTVDQVRAALAPEDPR